MISWSTELNELEKYLHSITGQIQSLEKELKSLLNASEEVTALLFARRSLEVMIADLCENVLKRPRGTEPLQNIVDRLLREKIISESIHTSMSNLIRISNYGAHPKEFDPRQVRGALIDLSIVVEWFISSKNFIQISPDILMPIPEKKNEVVRIDNNKTVIEEQIFETFTDPRDRHIYKIIKIGKQIWFAENLAFIPHISPPTKKGGIWVYNNFDTNLADAKIAKNYNLYGCLYDWKTAINDQFHICPSGWHLPTIEEWKILLTFLGGENEAGNALKMSGTSYWTNSGEGLSKKSGFSAIPGGYRDPNGSFGNLSEYSNWWTATDYGGLDAWCIYIGNNNSKVYSVRSNKEYGFSIRCIKDY